MNKIKNYIEFQKFPNLIVTHIFSTGNRSLIKLEYFMYLLNAWQPQQWYLMIQISQENVYSFLLSLIFPPHLHIYYISQCQTHSNEDKTSFFISLASNILFGGEHCCIMMSYVFLLAARLKMVLKACLECARFRGTR